MSTSFSQSPFILLCCQGRSGSTLLLRLLNTIDGYYLMGENSGAVKNLLYFYKSIKQVEEIRNRKNQEHYTLAWNNNFDYDLIINNIDGIFRNLYWSDKHKIFGFKEVRFGMGAYPAFEEEMNLLKEFFPNLKIVFLTRHIDELVSSAWWSKNPEQSKKQLLQQQENFKTYIEKTQANTSTSETFIFSLTYEDLCDNKEKLIKLYDFLGEKFDEQKYSDTISKKTT